MAPARFPRPGGFGAGLTGKRFPSRRHTVTPA